MLGLLSIFYIGFQSSFVRFGLTLYIKHGVLFSIFAIITYLLIEYVISAIKQHSNQRQETPLIFMRSVSFMIILVIIALLQLNYIEKREVIEVVRCTYYDEFDNIILYNTFLYSCPELTITEQTEDSFIFQTYEEITTTNRYGLVGMGMVDLVQYEDVVFDIEIQTNTTIEYENEQITLYDSKQTISVRYDINGNQKMGLKSIHRMVQNQYGVDSFGTIEREAVYIEEDVSIVPDFHYLFVEEDYVETRLYTTPITVNQAGDSDYQIMKERVMPDSNNNTSVLRHVNKHDSNSSDQVFYQLYTYEDDFYDGVEISTFSDHVGNYLRVERNRRDEDNWIHFYDLNYKQNNDGLYQLFYHGGLAGTNIPSSDDMSYYRVQDNQKDIILYTNDQKIYEIRDTEYGHMVVEWRHMNYDLFTPIETQQERYIGQMDSAYRRLMDYEYEIETMNHRLPPFLISKISPFCLE